MIFDMATIYNEKVKSQYKDKVSADVINSIVFASAFFTEFEIKTLIERAFKRISQDLNGAG